MSITLNNEIIKKYELSLGEVLVLLAIQNEEDLLLAKNRLLKKGLISVSYTKDTHLPEGNFITNKGNEILNKIILDSDKVVGTDDFTKRIELLIPKLQLLYPEGKNFNNQYWRGNKTDIKRKLQTFFKKYGDSYTDEQILTATKAYVSGFNGDYKFMRLLQYFIWKEEVRDGTKVLVSELANYIENAGQTNDLSTDWTSSLN